MKRFNYTAFFFIMCLFTSVVVQAQSPPLAPTNLTVTMGEYGSAILYWDSSAHAGGYKIYKAVDTSLFRSIALIGRRTFTDFYVAPPHVFHYYVTAVNLAGESSPSDTVTFTPGPPPPPTIYGIIRGLVTDDSTGQPIPGAIIRFFKVNNRFIMRGAMTDSLGRYHAAVDTGNIIIVAERRGYFPEFYDNAMRPESATVIALAEGDTVDANFGLRPIPPPVIVNVSGTVTDSVVGTPLAGAFVAYFHTIHDFREREHESGMFGGHPEERFSLPELGELHGVAWVGRTDSSGHYTAHLPEGPQYIAVAFQPGYEFKFYKDKVTPADADRIQFWSDTSGFDFALVQNPHVNDSIAGTVVDSNGAGVPSHVMVVRLTALGPRLTRYRMTDSLGNFAFHHVVQGNFFVRAIPVDGFLPAWYSSTECGVRNWHNADTVKVRVGSSALGINICVMSDSANGFATIGGGVHGSIAIQSAVSASAYQGVTVQAVSTTSGSVVAYDVTESDGSFSLENLPPGSYNIVVDQAGYSQSSTPTYTVDQNNGYTVSSGSVGISPDAPLAVNEHNGTLPSTYQLEQSYPNPFNPTVQIGYELPENSFVVLRIYNIIGQAVQTLVNGNQTAGYKKVGFDASSLPSGVYFYRIEATSTSHPDRVFLQTKKMILIK